jgi:Domain of unknown function (DUF5666)
MMRSILWLCSCLIVMLAGPLALTANAQGAGTKESSGVITDVSSTSVTIQLSKGGTKSNQTFTLDSSTQVIARGATKATKGQGRSSVTALLAKGDTVNVFYTESSGALRATEIRVTKKAEK